MTNDKSDTHPQKLKQINNAETTEQKKYPKKSHHPASYREIIELWAFFLFFLFSFFWSSTCSTVFRETKKKSTTNPSGVEQCCIVDLSNNISK